MERIQLFIETFLIFCLFLHTDIQAYGYKKRFLPKFATIGGSALALTTLNTLFYDSSFQYEIYIVLLIIAGILYTLFFINAHVIYSVSLQLELICCYAVMKPVWMILLSLTIADPNKNLVAGIIYYFLFGISMIACSLFFSGHTLKAPFEHPYRYFITITVIPMILLIMGLLVRYELDTSHRFEVTMNLIITLLLLVTHYLSYLHISSYNELIETRVINQHMELVQSHIERSSALVEQIRRDKHEMKNVYFYINSLLESGDYDELSEFVESKLLHRYDRLEEFHTGYSIIDYLLSQKACEAMDSGISFIADVMLPEQLNIEKSDLCSILQNLLDNAIDASKQEDERDIHIKIHEQKNYLSINVKNRSSVDVLKVNPSLLTTKKDKLSHGIGTRVIKKIVEKYDGAMDVSMEAGYFTVNIFLVN